jgi:hypothetical protein
MCQSTVRQLLQLARAAAAGTFVPPHIHVNQDEFIYVLEGRFDLIPRRQGIDRHGRRFIRLPMKIMHGLFNKSDQPIKCLFWVAPTGKLFDLFKKIDGVPDPGEVTRLAGLHDVNFLPPPPAEPALDDARQFRRKLGLPCWSAAAAPVTPRWSGARAAPARRLCPCAPSCACRVSAQALEPSTAPSSARSRRGPCPPLRQARHHAVSPRPHRARRLLRRRLIVGPAPVHLLLGKAGKLG